MTTAQLYLASCIQTTLPWRWRRHSCIESAPFRLHYLGDGDGTAVSSQLNLDYTTLAMATAQLYPSAQSGLHYLGDGHGTALSGQLHLDYTTLAIATAQLYPANSMSWSTLNAYSVNSSWSMSWASVWLEHRKHIVRFKSVFYNIGT